MTDEEIKIEATKIAMKESCHRCDKVLCDYPSKYCKWFNGCYKLAKENAELKEELHQKSDTNHSLVEQLADKDIKVAELEEQIEVKKLQILELKAQIGNMKCENSYVVSDEHLNSVPCYTFYECKHCCRRSW